MTLSRRDRRAWRIIFWVLATSAAVSAYFGYAVAPADAPPLRSALSGVLTSLLISVPIALVELRWQRSPALRRLRRLPLAAYFAVQVLFYSAVIIGALLFMRIFVVPRDTHGVFDETFRNSIVFSIAMAVVGNLVLVMGGLLGFTTVKNLVIGRYVQPRREQLVFLLIDMKDSTGLAERLGPIRFHELLNSFFSDVSDAALECEASIHKYVGDETILTWSLDDSMADGECLACPFIARDRIAAHGERYLRRFGAVPEFRAALHCGEIVAGEIGDVRREIAYVGDTLNVAARLLEAAKVRGHDILVSADLLKAATLPEDLVAEPLPTLDIRGRNAPLEISALSCVGKN